jgi:hypothetical protein
MIVMVKCERVVGEWCEMVKSCENDANEACENQYATDPKYEYLQLLILFLVTEELTMISPGGSQPILDPLCRHPVNQNPGIIFQVCLI